MIHKLEMDEGYYLQPLIIDGYQAAIYLVDDRKNYKYVEGGDWVTFFREKL
jgi:hypothetical protein